MKVIDVQVAQFILCKYDDHHWVGMVLEVNEEENDGTIKVMHPNYPSVTYHLITLPFPIHIIHGLFMMAFAHFQKHT